MKEALGERIKHYRRLKKLSQDGLASAMGVHKQTIAGWEGGRSWPEYDKLIAIAGALGIPVETLFETIGKSAPPPSATMISLMKIIEQQEEMLRAMAHAMDVYERIKKHPVLQKIWDLKDQQLIRLARRVSLMEDEPQESETTDSSKIKGKL